MINIAFVSLLLMLTSTVPIREVFAKLEMHVPKGMPIKLRPSRDKTDPRITKYIIKREVKENVKAATFLVAMVDKNNNILPGSRNKFTTRNLSDPMTIATGDPNVAKIVIVVESLETSTGKWVPNNPMRAISIDAVLVRGKNALPGAKEVLAKQN